MTGFLQVVIFVVYRYQTFFGWYVLLFLSGVWRLLVMVRGVNWFVGVLLLLMCNSNIWAWGCSSAEIEAGSSTVGCLNVNGVDRHYRLFVPHKYQVVGRPLPLLIGLHGGADNPKSFERYSQFSTLSEKTAEFIAVYPKGVNKHWNDGRANVGAGVDDVAFLRALVKHLKRDLKLPVAPKKIFITGISNGGLMAMRVACEHPRWIAGIAVVAASETKQLSRKCSSRLLPMAAVFVFGDQDTAFLPSGLIVNPVKQKQLRGKHIGIDQTVSHWVKANHCGQFNRSRPINAVAADQTTVVKRTYQSCKKPVVYFKVKGGGHRWADSTASNGRLIRKMLNMGYASQEINAAEEIWSVFR